MTRAPRSRSRPLPSGKGHIPGGGAASSNSQTGNGDQIQDSTVESRDPPILGCRAAEDRRKKKSKGKRRLKSRAPTYALTIVGKILYRRLQKTSFFASGASLARQISSCSLLSWSSRILHSGRSRSQVEVNSSLSSQTECSQESELDCPWESSHKDRSSLGRSSGLLSTGQRDSSRGDNNSNAMAVESRVKVQGSHGESSGQSLRLSMYRKSQKGRVTRSMARSKLTQRRRKRLRHFRQMLPGRNEPKHAKSTTIFSGRGQRSDLLNGGSLSKKRLREAPQPAAASGQPKDAKKVGIQMSPDDAVVEGPKTHVKRLAKPKENDTCTKMEVVNPQTETFHGRKKLDEKVSTCKEAAQSSVKRSSRKGKAVVAVDHVELASNNQKAKKKRSDNATNPGATSAEGNRQMEASSDWPPLPGRAKTAKQIVMSKMCASVTKMTRRRWADIARRAGRDSAAAAACCEAGSGQAGVSWADVAASHAGRTGSQPPAADAPASASGRKKADAPIGTASATDPTCGGRKKAGSPAAPPTPARKRRRLAELRLARSDRIWLTCPRVQSLRRGQAAGSAVTPRGTGVDQASSSACVVDEMSEVCSQQHGTVINLSKNGQGKQQQQRGQRLRGGDVNKCNNRQRADASGSDLCSQLSSMTFHMDEERPKKISLGYRALVRSDKTDGKDARRAARLKRQMSARQERPSSGKTAAGRPVAARPERQCSARAGVQMPLSQRLADKAAATRCSPRKSPAAVSARCRASAAFARRRTQRNSPSVGLPRKLRPESACPGQAKDGVPIQASSSPKQERSSTSSADSGGVVWRTDNNNSRLRVPNKAVFSSLQENSGEGPVIAKSAPQLSEARRNICVHLNPNLQTLDMTWWNAYLQQANGH